MLFRKTAHLIETFHRHQSRQWFALSLDDEFIVPQGDAIQQVANPLSDIERGHLLPHGNTSRSTIIVAPVGISNLQVSSDRNGRNMKWDGGWQRGVNVMSRSEGQRQHRLPPRCSTPSLPPRDGDFVTCHAIEVRDGVVNLEVG
ncbi:MAG TPA: hypothetical protein VLA99_08625 [Nitrospiraceae bacterium]|nr:hypothetical protein [Nitrospiraceae bacterium]